MWISLTDVVIYYVSTTLSTVHSQKIQNEILAIWNGGIAIYGGLIAVD